MKRILLATGNPGKAEEIRHVLAESGAEFLSLGDFEKLSGSSAPLVAEDADSYYGNCLLKARAYNLWSNLPVIADDTGLEVAALNNEPGIYSARFGGAGLSALRRNNKLLESLSGQNSREARFICEIIFLISADEFTAVRGELTGSISTEISGNGGFGYDSVFQLTGTGKTLAQAKEEDPGYLTHRKKALHELNNSALFQGFIKGN